MDEEHEFCLEREANRQHLTDQGAAKDSVRLMQLYSLLDHERRSELIRLATRLLIAQHIKQREGKAVNPDSDEVSAEVESRIDQAEPYEEPGSMLVGLNDYTCSVKEYFFPDGKEDLIIRCSLSDREIGENFESTFRDQVALARDQLGAFNLRTQDEYSGRREGRTSESKWRRALEWEEWIRDWRDAFFYELFGSTDPDRIRERWEREIKARPASCPD